MRISDLGSVIEEKQCAVMALPHETSDRFPTCWRLTSLSVEQRKKPDFHGWAEVSRKVCALQSSQFSSVAQSCLTLCDPMDCSTPGFPVHHQLPELAQTHVHWASDAIQPPHPLSSPSPPALNLYQHQGQSSIWVQILVFLSKRCREHWANYFNLCLSFLKYSVRIVTIPIF